LVEGARFNAQGDRLLTFGDNGTTRLWDVQSADEVASIDQPTAYVTAAEFNADGSLIASASAYGAFIWDGRTGEKIRRLERDDSESKLKANVPAAIAFHPDGNSVVVVDETNELIHWELQEAMPTAVFDMGRDQIKIIRFSPDATFLVTGDDAGAIRIIDLLTGQERAQLLGHPGAITRLNISATGDLITSASLAESNIRVWDVQSGLELARLGGLKSTVSSVEFSLDGSQVIAASYYDPTVRLWDISALRPIATSNGGVNSLLIEDICNPQTGKLRGDLRYLSEGDAAVVPFLKASVGIDVCK
jgi:WD40 repeat protein